MRVLLGLAAFSLAVSTSNALLSVTPDTGEVGAAASAYQNPITNSPAGASIYFYTGSGASLTLLSPTSSSAVSYLNSGTQQTNQITWTMTLPSGTTACTVGLTTNTYVSLLQYANSFTASNAVSWNCDPCGSLAIAGTSPSIASQTYTCDSNGPVTNTPVQSTTISTPVFPGGPAYGAYAYRLGYKCATLTRSYTLGGFVSGTNYFALQIWDNSSAGDSTAFSFNLNLPPTVKGDPQIYGLQGQDFQVHGIPDEIFSLITYPNLQVNARFVYLSQAECHDNFTACFAHPGTYIGEEGIRLGNDKIHVKSGSFKKGLTVSVNGQRVSGKQRVKLGSVDVMNHRRVIVTTPVMTLTISNSDKFLNQETTLHDAKLLALGQERRVLSDGEQFHPEVPLHGLQGQTWRNVEYPSGLEYEGSINDYHVVDGNLFGTEFVFNQFKL